MRYYILDDLIEPSTGAALRVEHVEVVRRPGPPVEPCRHWRGYRGCAVADLAPGDCCTCHDQWIVSGELVAKGTGTQAALFSYLDELDS